MKTSLKLAKLAGLSRYLGRDQELVLAGGGNTSYKNKNNMWIKASGSQLRGITQKDFVCLDRKKLEVIGRKKYPKDDRAREAEVAGDLLSARVNPELCQTPSVESYFHNLIDQPWVAHIHPLVVNTLTCSKNGKDLYKKIVGKDTLWIDFYKPGYTLSSIMEKKIRDFIKRHKKPPRAIFLQNHGLIVGGDDPEGIKKVIGEILEGIKGNLVPLEDRKEKVKIDPVRVSLRIRRSLGEEKRRIIYYLRCSEIPKGVIRGAFTPDEVVYCKRRPLWIKGGELSRESLASEPKVVAVDGVGIFGIGRNCSSARNAACVFLDAVKIYKGSFSFGGPRFLKSEDAAFIDNWEVEKYRRRLIEGKKKRIEGRIAIVTGAAQGLGMDIAEELVRQGACVVIADINRKWAEKVARRLQKKYGEERAVSFPLDVTREAEVEEMVNFTVRRWGGVDILISNAGILTAGNILELPYKDFHRVMGVNCYGYFLCAQKVAGVMAEQGYGDIIQINSKSGKVGSQANSPYASSKFAGVGLTQSMAMDLAPYNVFVNAICPGNLLSSGLWQRKGGLLEQYLEAGKVPGAKSKKDIEDYYKNLTLLKRGCVAEDIMRTIFYILEQRGETGQAYNVTQGQEMR